MLVDTKDTGGSKEGYLFTREEAQKLLETTSEIMDKTSDIMIKLLEIDYNLKHGVEEDSD